MIRSFALGEKQFHAPVLHEHRDAPLPQADDLLRSCEVSRGETIDGQGAVVPA